MGGGRRDGGAEGGGVGVYACLKRGTWVGGGQGKGRGWERGEVCLSVTDGRGRVSGSASYTQSYTRSTLRIELGASGGLVGG